MKKLTFADVVTSLNLVAGILAIYSAILGETRTAMILIVAALLFDYYDGKVARYYGQDHAFGRELDSLADIGSFGIAPGIILLIIYEFNSWILAAAVLYAVAGAFRLARFNLTKKAKHFQGLPIPGAAFLALASSFLPLTAWMQSIILLLLGALMVSTLKVKKFL